MGQRLALGLIALWGSACGITARSDDFRCAGTQDCSDGRSCVDGWCVAGQGDGGAGDGANAGADGALDDAAACPDVCDSCLRATCMISCEDGGSCQELVVCPPGMECLVRCGQTSCAAGVDCSAADACDIRCDETGACSGPITCGPGRCDVACSGPGTCSGGIDCSDSCRCDTDCDGIGSCAIEPSCPFASCVNGIECTDVGQACHACQ